MKIATTKESENRVVIFLFFCGNVKNKIENKIPVTTKNEWQKRSAEKKNYIKNNCNSKWINEKRKVKLEINKSARDFQIRK